MTGPSNAAALLGAWVAAALVVLSACGGTNGREDLPNGGDLSSANEDATVDGQAESSVPLDSGSDAVPDGAIEAAPDGALDATLGDDSGDAGFDVDIMYADAARLPHFEGGAIADSGTVEAAPPPWANWPTCACDQLASNGQDIVVDEAGTCPSFVWTRSATCDSCLRNAGCDTPPPPTWVFPPCCDVREAGAATTGPGQGIPKYDLCAALTYCAYHKYVASPNSSVVEIYCGDASLSTDCPAGKGNGVCRAEVESAFETQDPHTILLNFTSKAQGQLGSEGVEVASVLGCVSANCATQCLTAGGGATDAGGASD